MMSAERFDAMARALSGRRPRRAALKVLAGAALAAPAALAAAGEAEARCRRRGNRCSRRNRCCGDLLCARVGLIRTCVAV